MNDFNRFRKDILRLHHDRVKFEILKLFAAFPYLFHDMSFCSTMIIKTWVISVNSQCSKKWINKMILWFAWPRMWQLSSKRSLSRPYIFAWYCSSIYPPTGSRNHPSFYWSFWKHPARFLPISATSTYVWLRIRGQQCLKSRILEIHLLSPDQARF